ncbi:MAG: SUMF1/EgtB/PvdO family nonheme iron enzyme [Verrucomicrobiales bacterium]|nr:SUMF1/EgtB/PvdO family nonheme iron enzyme [Verrucomicrobiales bacterium]
MAGLTWLHLSDWHQKGRDFDRQVVRDALLADLRDRATLHPALAEIDLVIFSGDAAWAGKKEEFQTAREVLFDPVLRTLQDGGRAPEKFFFVPGNHDLNRDHIAEMLPPGLQKPLATDAEVQKWLTDDARRARALEPFKDYTDFVTGFTGQENPAYANTWNGFIGQKTVGILCLNSAWMCGRHQTVEGEIDDRGFLTVGEPQIHEGLERIASADVRLCILHHPFPWLADFDCDRVEARLKRGCHFILHGHEHKPNFDLSHSLAGQCAIIPAGASYERRTAANPRYANAYNLVHLDFDTGKGTIYLRRWSDPRTAWLPDQDSCDGGLFTFPLPEHLRPDKKIPSAPVLPSASDGGESESEALRLYRERLKGETAELELFGLGHGVQIKLPIEQAYVPLNVAATRDLRNESAGRFDEELLQQRAHCDPNVRLCEVFKWAGRFRERGVLLLGDPGAGKTTGARQFCWRVLTEPDLPKTLGLQAGTIPVFLRLRNLTSQHLAQGLTAFITDGVAAATLPDDQQPGPELLLRRGVLWIFDGLDEVVSEAARVRVCEWIKQALGERTGDFFLVTSRYTGYQGDVNLQPGFSVFHVRPLENDQSADFVDHWYRAVHGRLHADDPEALARAEAEAAALMDLLQQEEYRIGRLKELPSNPLLLTILCLVHHQDHNLPRRRADLYARCVRVLLEHWRKDLWKKAGIAAYDPEAAEGVLANAAWWLHEQEGRTTHTVEELGAVAGAALAALGPGAGLGRDGEVFIKRMRDESGILAMWSAGQCGFLHLTFQEYLAGLHAAREGKAEDLVKQVGQSWWREVILVAAAIGSKDFATKFFAALAAGDAVAREGALVDQCLDEARYAVIEPFVTGLTQKGVKPERQLDLLRRLKPFARPEEATLIAACRELADSPHRELASLARELLQRAGITVERPTIEIAGAPLEQWVGAKTGIAFIAIPAGEFDMGSNEYPDEQPVHRVRITKPFQLGKYPVTNAEYGRFLKANPEVKPPPYWTNSQFNDPQQPVVTVSWEDAQVFCQWAGCRLPTEAEWEYACRAGNEGRFCFGDDESKLGDYAWWKENSGGRTHPVGQKQPNAWGLHDVHGNVWEWCEDWYSSDYYRKSPPDDPSGPEKGEHVNWANGPTRVLRGGSWGYDDPDFLRAANRLIGRPGIRYNFIGFRVVWVSESR